MPIIGVTISEISQREAELAGKLYYIGMGAIGGRIAKLAKAFDMNVIGIRRNIDPIKNRVDEAYTPQNFEIVAPLFVA